MILANAEKPSSLIASASSCHVHSMVVLTEAPEDGLGDGEGFALG